MRALEEERILCDHDNVYAMYEDTKSTRNMAEYSQEVLVNGEDLRLVFTGDGVVVGVVIRSLERYDLVKIKPTESEAEH